MRRSGSCLLAAIGLAAALTLAIIGPSNAQHNKSEDGTGAGAGYSPPIEERRGGAVMPDAASPMNAPPMPPDDSAGQAAPAPDAAAPDDSTKKDEATPPTDAPTGADQPD